MVGRYLVREFNHRMRMAVTRKVVAIDNDLLERSRAIARTILALSVSLFFSVGLLAAPIGDPLLAENTAAGLMLPLCSAGSCISVFGLNAAPSGATTQIVLEE